jgi:hypothetical protein
MTNSLRKWFWQNGRWQTIAWVCGIAATACWVYSGMPMICH